MLHRRTGFTIVELLVVIAIIAVLASVLMPALAKARDTARTMLCQAQMKQLYVAGDAIKADFDDAYMPAWWYAHRPEGPTPAEAEHWDACCNWLGHPDFGYNYEHFGHMLISLYYLPEGQAADLTGIAAADQYGVLADHAGKSIMSCPNAYLPRGASDDTPLELRNTTRADSHLAPITTDSVRVPIRMYGRAPNSRNTDGTVYLTNYMINQAFGSFHWYTSHIANDGFWPVYTHQLKSPPSEVGYMFEQTEFSWSNVRAPTILKRDVNSWHTGWSGKFNPHTPHRGYKKSNLVMADGSLREIEQDLTGKPFTWKWR